MHPPEHRVYSNSTYRAIQDVAIGDTLYNSEGDYFLVEGKEKVNKETTVYNFEVAGTHNYYAGGLGLLVHDECYSSGDVRNILGITKKLEGVSNLAEVNKHLDDLKAMMKVFLNLPKVKILTRGRNLVMRE